MTNEVKVRIATVEDLDAAMKLALFASEEMAIAPPNPHKVLNDIWPALTGEAGLVGVIGEPGEELEGAILLRISTLWYTDQVVLEEKGLFVNPKYRGAKGGRATKLCDFAKKAADELGLPLIIGVFSSENSAGKTRMYTRIFGEPSGALWLYNGRTGDWKNYNPEEAAATA